MRAVNRWLSLLLVALAAFTLSLPAVAQDDPPTEPDAAATQETDEPDAGAPIAIELAQGIELLNQQLADQQALLKNAQTEREQQLIRNHIRLLQKERRSLEHLLHKLVGPEIDLLEERREQREQREEKREELIRDRQD